MTLDDRAQEALDTVLGRQGWKFRGSRVVAPALVEYEIERLRDGKTASTRILLPDLLTNPLDRAVERLPPDQRPPVSMHLSVQLLLLARSTDKIA